jgi:hypothetical protein
VLFRRFSSLTEALAVLWLPSLFYGAWMIYRPAAFNVAGATLLGAALYGADAENRRAAREPCGIDS